MTKENISTAIFISGIIGGVFGAIVQLLTKLEVTISIFGLQLNLLTYTAFAGILIVVLYRKIIKHI